MKTLSLAGMDRTDVKKVKQNYLACVYY